LRFLLALYYCLLGPVAIRLSHTYDELHYPNYPASWITDPVLPFLDKAAQQSPATPAMYPSRQSAATLTTHPARAAPSASSDAQRLLTMAQLFMDNGNTEKARTNLQAIITKYPHDPAAIAAKKLLDSLPQPPPQ
jgi:hypothetical protein